MVDFASVVEKHGECLVFLKAGGTKQFKHVKEAEFG